MSKNDLLVSLLGRYIQEYTSGPEPCDHSNSVYTSARLKSRADGNYPAICSSCGARGYVDRAGLFHEDRP